MLLLYRRGFSAIELILTLALCVIVVAIGAPKMKEAKEKAESKAVAMLIAEELRYAKEKARCRNIPVAVALPTDNGAKAHSQSYYVMEGENNPRISKVVDFSAEYPTVCSFVGCWDLDTTKLADPTKVNTISQPRTGGNSGGFNINNWGPQSKDFIFLFTTSGSVKTNGLPNFDGNFHIVVTRGISYMAAASPSALKNGGFLQCFMNIDSYYKLSSVFEPYTINITPLGDVTVTEGVTALSDSGGAISDRPLSMPSPPTPPTAGTSANQVPVIASLDLLPRSNSATPPSGANVLVGRRGYVTLTVKATDANGDPLYYQWAGTGGVFSGPDGQARMEWSYSEDKWISIAEWKPPPGMAGGERFTLTCTVSDGRGGTASRSCIVEIKKDKILFTSGRSGENQLYIMNLDGSEVRKLTEGPGQNWGSMRSPDGQKIAFTTSRKGDGSSQIYIMNSDGSGQHPLTNSPGDNSYPSWSPDGAKIAFTTNRDGNNEVYIMNSDGTNQHNFTNNQGNGLPYLANSQGQDWYSKWSPDGRYIAFSRGIWSSDTAVWIQRVDGSEVPRPVTPAGFYRNIAWNPDARTLLIAYDVGSKGLLTFDIYASMNQTPTTISGPNGFFDDDPEYSLDGTKILISSNRSGNYEIYMMNSDGTELRQLTDHPAADWRPCWIREYY